MFNVCPTCGEYAEEKAIDPAGPFAICPYCGHRHRFVRLPLFVITGASGSGKTTLCMELVPRMPACIFMESDILWRSEFATPQDDYRSYRNLWLRVAKNISQGGRPVVLCGSAMPDQFEACPERRYFTTLYYLAIVCNEEVLTQRLLGRPGWRKSSSPEFIERMVSWNGWLKEHAASTNPRMTLLDNTTLTIEESAACVQRWVLTYLDSPGPLS